MIKQQAAFLSNLLFSFAELYDTPASPYNAAKETDKFMSFLYWLDQGFHAAYRIPHKCPLRFEFRLILPNHGAYHTPDTGSQLGML
jgi:hypothetical protein